MFFYIRKIFKGNEYQNSQHLKKMLWKSPASDAWVPVYKNVDF